MVPPARIELATSPLPRVRSTTELRRHEFHNDSHAVNQTDASEYMRQHATFTFRMQELLAKIILNLYRIDYGLCVSSPLLICDRFMTPFSKTSKNRKAREAEALRTNLIRRKEQLRARKTLCQTKLHPTSSTPVE